MAPSLSPGSKNKEDQGRCTLSIKEQTTEENTAKNKICSDIAQRNF